jgi:hypothetical protein
VDWTNDPIATVGDYTNAESVSCKHINGGDAVESYYGSCAYASHGGNPWQSAAWSFTANGLSNGAALFSCAALAVATAIFECVDHDLVESPRPVEVEAGIERDSHDYISA